MSRPQAPESTWKIERSGTFEGYDVFGWRYAELPVWHIKISLRSARSPANTYMIAAGEFYPDSIRPDERYAILRLLAVWEPASVRHP